MERSRQPLVRRSPYCYIILRAIFKGVMARLGILRQGDVRCFSGTLIVVVFFGCVILFTTTPEKRSVTLDLPRDLLLQMGSRSDHNLQEPLEGSTKASEAASDDKDDAKKGASRSIKSDPKHKLKSKWIKDELPGKEEQGKVEEKEDDKELHTAGKDDETARAVKSDSSESVAADAKEPSSSEEKRQQETNSHQHVAQPAADFIAKGADQPPEKKETHSANDVMGPAGSSTNTGKSKSPPAKTSSSKPQGKTSTANSQALKITSVTDLNSTMLYNFTSPFIDSPITERNLKKIITWYNPDRSDKFSFRKRAFDSCPVSACKFVHPLPEGVQPDAILSNGATAAPPPPRQHKDQVFVFYEMESPESTNRSSWSEDWNSVFNWTWTYRHDSDIWQPFGLLRRRTKDPLGLEYYQNLAKDKSRLITWLSDTCPSPTASKRDEYVTELANHVRVHRMGSCGEKSPCGKEDPTCAESLSKKYFFLLVLEDDMCKDHVTEVFYRAWQDGMDLVPVVRGGADYVTYFPQGTFINADWFDSAQQLGEYLIELAKNKKLYSEILWRKTHWQRAPQSRPQEKAVCYLCRMLHQVPTHRKRYPDLRRWYENNVCRAPRPFRK